MKDIKKEDIENLSFKDITYLILEKEKKSMNTLDLFSNIVKLLELPSNTIDNKIGDYYTSLTTDKRFLLVDGMWDLRTRHTSDKLLSSVDDDEDEEEDEEGNLLEEDNYDDDINFDEELSDDEDTPYGDDDDDDLSDLVIVDDDEMDLENN